MTAANCVKCGINARAMNSSYCLECKRRAMRRTRAKKPLQKGTPEYEQMKCRSYANAYLKRGLLVRGPCEICADLNTWMYHEDYAFPLKVRWFCEPHHRARRKQERDAKKAES